MVNWNIVARELGYPSHAERLKQMKRDTARMKHENKVMNTVWAIAIAIEAALVIVAAIAVIGRM
ncbi:MAG: hypothetical protein IJ466_07410 [Clostridia bacterium]|nr:hypothetical protein [Clostridia bacterium]